MINFVLGAVIGLVVAAASAFGYYLYLCYSVFRDS